MERMVLDAVRGKPTTAPSRTEHFRSRTRAQTPGPPSDSDSGGDETRTEANAESEIVDVTGHGDPTNDSSSFGDCDSAEEMALIWESFKRTTAAATSLMAASGTDPEDTIGG